MDAGVQPDSSQHYPTGDADHNDSPLEKDQYGPIGGPLPTTAVASNTPPTYTQPFPNIHRNPPPNNAQWPLTYAMTPLPEPSTQLPPPSPIMATSPAENSDLPVPSPQMSTGGSVGPVSLGQASFPIGTSSYVAATPTSIITPTMSADASMDSSTPTITNKPTMATVQSQSAVLATASPVSNAASEITEIFTPLSVLFSTPLSSVLASAVTTPAISVLPVSSLSPTTISVASSFFSAASVLSESAVLSSPGTSFRSSVLSISTVSSSESTGSPTQSLTTSFETSTLSLSTTTSTTPSTTSPTRTRTRTSTSLTPTPSTTHATSSQTHGSTSSASSQSQSALTPAQTTVPPVPSSNLTTGHGTPFYLGLALGIVIFIASTAALIAWAIRLRSRALRRRDEREAAIPWVKGDPDRTDEMDHLEAGRSEGFNSGNRNNGPGNGGSGAGGAHSSAVTGAGAAGIGVFQSPWSPRHGTGQAISKHSPDSNPFDGGAFFRPGYSPGQMRKLPSHMVDQELATRAQKEAASANHMALGRLPGSPSRQNGYAAIDEVGTPREALTMPRFLQLERGGLNWNNPNSGDATRPSIATRIRNLNKPTREDSLENLPPLPTPGAHLNQVDQSWTSSWKTGLSNAFTAVSSRFSGATSATAVSQNRITPEEAADRFTRAPSKRALRRSLRDHDRYYGSNEKLGLARGGSRSTTASKPWSLEERDDGTGVVHLRIPEEGTEDEKHPSSRPSINGPNLSFGDGKTFGSVDDFDKEAAYAVNPTEPLHVPGKPQRALISPSSRSRNRRSGKVASDESEYFSVMSRETTASSVYSIQPTSLSDPRAVPLPKLTLVPSQGVLYIPSSRDQDPHNIPNESVVLHPDDDSLEGLDRESSTHESMMSSSTADTRERERYDGVGDALRTRVRGKD